MADEAPRADQPSSRQGIKRLADLIADSIWREFLDEAPRKEPEGDA